MDKRGLIVIPYRNRQTHLDCLLLYLQKYFDHIPRLVVEQFDQAVWNKGLLFNAAYKEMGYNYDYMVLHDVDFIPARTVDYSYVENPTLLSTECSQFNYEQCYATFFGGVVGVCKEHYELVNGFSNNFKGWGGEDDEFRRRFLEKGMTTYRRASNRFENFTHPRPDVQPYTGKDWNNPDYQHNWKLVHEPPNMDEGLSTAKYQVFSMKEFPDCVHLRVKTDIHG